MRRVLISAFIPATLAAMVLSGAEDARAATSTYTFSGVTTSNHGSGGYPIAIEHDSEAFPWTSAADQNDSANPTDAEYVNITADNAAEWATDDPGKDDYMAITYRFFIQEALADITNVEITWNGNTDTNTSNHSIHLRKDGFDEFGGTNTWVQLGSSLSIPPDVDTDLIRSLTTGFSTYINASTGQFEFVVTSDGTSDDMRTNYIQVVVTYTPPTLYRSVGTTATNLNTGALAGIGTGSGAPSKGSGCFISTAGGGSQ